MWARKWFVLMWRQQAPTPLFLSLFFPSLPPLAASLQSGPQNTQDQPESPATTAACKITSRGISSPYQALLRSRVLSTTRISLVLQVSVTSSTIQTLHAPQDLFKPFHIYMDRLPICQGYSISRALQNNPGCSQTSCPTNHFPCMPWCHPRAPR
jgi:hypothetical protein